MASVSVIDNKFFEFGLRTKIVNNTSLLFSGFCRILQPERSAWHFITNLMKNATEFESLYVTASDLEWDCKVGAKKYWNEEAALKKEDERWRWNLTLLGSLSTFGASAGAISPLSESYPRAHRVFFGFVALGSGILTSLVNFNKYDEKAALCKDLATSYDSLEKRIRLFRELHLTNNLKDLTQARHKVEEFNVERLKLNSICPPLFDPKSHSVAAESARIAKQKREEATCKILAELRNGKTC